LTLAVVGGGGLQATLEAASTPANIDAIQPLGASGALSSVAHRLTRTHRAGLASRKTRDFMAGTV
jgi:hypothetical protein